MFTWTHSATWALTRRITTIYEWTASWRVKYIHSLFPHFICAYIDGDKEQEIDKNGWEAIMEPADNANDMWKIPKYGARVPFVLKIRLSGDQHFLGTITIIDLLFPFCPPSATDNQDHAFPELGNINLPYYYMSLLLLLISHIYHDSAISQQLCKCQLWRQHHKRYESLAYQDHSRMLLWIM